MEGVFFLGGGECDLTIWLLVLSVLEGNEHLVNDKTILRNFARWKRELPVNYNYGDFVFPMVVLGGGVIGFVCFGWALLTTG